MMLYDYSTDYREISKLDKDHLLEDLKNLAHKNLVSLVQEQPLIIAYTYSLDGQIVFSDDVKQEIPYVFKINQEGSKIKFTTSSLVGFIGLGYESIVIKSRFDQNRDEDFFLHYMLEKALNVKINQLKHPYKESSILNLLYCIFPLLLHTALEQGLYAETKTFSCTSYNLKGPIDLSRQIKEQSPFNGRFAYSTCDFTSDNKVTELIRHTIEYLNSQTEIMEIFSSNQAKFDAMKIIEATPNYRLEDRQLIIDLNQRTPPAPFYNKYLPLYRLCLAILNQQRLRFNQNINCFYGILINIANLWEEYLASVLLPHQFKHPNNRYSTEPLYLDEEETIERFPDFYRLNDPITIIDAKYKEKVKRDDIHQIIAYLYRLKGKKGILVLPKKQGDDTFKNEIHHLSGYGKEQSTTYESFYINIPQNVTDYTEFSKLMQQEEAKLIQHIMS